MRLSDAEQLAAIRAGEGASTPRRVFSPSPWRLIQPLHSWQRDALAQWRVAGRRGVVEAATGTGKSMLAAAAIEDVANQHGADACVAIVVPSRALVAQWRRVLEEELGIHPREIGEQHSAATVWWQRDHRVLITVVNTARLRLYEVLNAWRADGRTTLLIVDECHRTGSDDNSLIYEGSSQYQLGLSATPERADGRHVTHIYPGLGEPVYRYRLREALDDGVLASVRLINLYFDLGAKERGEWEDLGSRIDRLLRILFARYPGLEGSETFWGTINRVAREGDVHAGRLQAALVARRQLLTGASGRARCVSEVYSLLAGLGVKSVIFHDSIVAAERAHDELEQLGVAAAIEHSRRPTAERSEALTRFQTGRAKVLVTVRALDEGIDVPDAAVAVIAAGTQSPRQRVQRLGRILRRTTEHKRAVAFSILARTTPEEAIGRGDDQLVGASRVSHHRWPHTPVGQELLEARSSYSAAEADASATTWATVVALDRLEPISAEDPADGDDPPAFSLNGWHPTTEVAAGLKIPLSDVVSLGRDLRRTFRRSLDPEMFDRDDVLHGTEIEALERVLAARSLRPRRRKR